MFIAAETGSNSLKETAGSINREDTVLQPRVAVDKPAALVDQGPTQGQVWGPEGTELRTAADGFLSE